MPNPIPHHAVKVVLRIGMEAGNRGQWWLAAAASLCLVTSAAASSVVSSTEIVTPEPVLFQGFGEAVAIDGDTAVIGAKEAAYVYERRSGAWVYVQKLSPDEPPPDATEGPFRFGRAVAIDGDLVAVGAPQWPWQFGRGAVFLFSRRGGVWAQTGIIRGVGFGYSVALQSGTLAIGAPGNWRTDAGLVHMFTRYPSGWREEEVVMGQLRTRVGGPPGVSVALDGNTAAVGSGNTGESPHTAGGAAYVLVRRGNKWLQEAKLEEGGTSKSVAVEGDTAVVDTDYGGVVTIYSRTEQGWTLQQTFTGARSTRYGASVSLKNDRLLIGQPLFDGPGFHDGAVHLYLRDRETGRWIFAEQLRGDDTQFYGDLGAAVAQSDRFAIAGVPFHVVNEVAAGGARIYEWSRPRMKLDLPENITLEATSANGAIGTFSVKAHDANGIEQPVTLSVPPGSMFPLGTMVVRAWATDATGETATGTFTVRVRDSQPPVIRHLSVSPRILWPPDRRLVIVRISARATDSIDPAPSVRFVKVASNEAGVRDDWLAIDDLTLGLRAERAAAMTPRIYTITVEARDSAGNVERRNVLVTVPSESHGQPQKLLEPPKDYD